MSIELPKSIGPFQVVRSLGVGGMGEVFLAFDPRLKRQVAIKRIRPEVSWNPERQARFQREAELAAGLNHSAIVHVHDLLTEDGVDHIVMEYVAGPSLRRRIEEQGPLPPDEALSISRALAEGLAYAHRQGVIHRDLKTENVLLTPEGRPKITDFGIARRVATDDPTHTRDVTLTREGALLGTYRTMAPEHLCGDAVDARSDLFSLGVLLYEVFGGRSPFQADTNRQTMHQVLHHDPPPVHEVSPGVPLEISQLIGHLLEKDPLLRPRGAEEVVERLRPLVGESTATGGGATVTTDARTANRTTAPTAPPRDNSTYGTIQRRRWLAAGLALAVVVLLVVLSPWRPRLFREHASHLLYVTVMEPVFAGAREDPATALLSFAIRNASTRTLISLEGVSVKPQDLDEPPEHLTGLARALGVDEILTSDFTCNDNYCLVAIHRVSGIDGGTLWSDEVHVQLHDLWIAAKSISVHIRQAYSAFSLRPGFGELDVEPEIYQEFLEVRRAFDAGENVDSELLANAKSIRLRADRFTEALLLEAEIATELSDRADDSSLIEDALQLIEQAQALAPGDPSVLFTRAHCEIEAGQLEAAESTQRKLEDIVPGDVRILELRARLEERRGKPQRALELYQAAIEQRPSTSLLYNYAKEALKHGEIKEARDAIMQYQRLVPESRSARGFLAIIELTAGEFEHVVESLKGSDSYLDLSNLGLAYSYLGEYDQAATALERALAATADNPFILFNLADVRWMQGRRDEAEKLYRKILDSTNPGGELQLAGIRAQAHAHLGHRRKAVAAIDRLLQGAPGDRDAAYEASLVYALVGDYTTAAYHAGRALDLGYDIRCFNLPWFDELRSTPDFQELAR